MTKAEKAKLRDLLALEIQEGRIIPVEIISDNDVSLEYSRESEHALVRVLMGFESFDRSGIVENALGFGCKEQVSDLAGMVYHEIAGVPHGELPLHLLFSALVKEVTAIMLEEIKQDVFSKKELAALARFSPAWDKLSHDYELELSNDND